MVSLNEMKEIQKEGGLGWGRLRHIKYEVPISYLRRSVKESGR